MSVFFTQFRGTHIEEEYDKNDMETRKSQTAEGEDTKEEEGEESYENSMEKSTEIFLNHIRERDGI